jgi:hypothetical protein
MGAWLSAWQRVHGTLRVTAWSGCGKRQDHARNPDLGKREISASEVIE